MGTRPPRLAFALAVELGVALAGRGARAQAPPDAITAPTVLGHQDADYPPAARAAGVQGTVVLVVTLSSTGVVESVEVIESAGKLLDDAAMRAVQAWTFSPAMRGGVAVRSKVRVPFRFELASPSVPEARLQTGEATDEAADAVPVFSASPEDTEGTPSVVHVRGAARAAPRNASEFQITVGALANLPFENSTEMIELAPGFVVTNEGGAELGQHIYLRGFSSDEGQNFEFSVDGVPINESGNVDVNGFASPHFIIPEVVESLHVTEGTFDPRQGNYAAAASVDYHLGLERRGLTARYTLGSWGTDRMLVLWGPNGESTGTFAAAELHRTDGFGQNRDSRGASAMSQYEGPLGDRGIYRVSAQAYADQFHGAGEPREDDVAAGRIGFYDTYDARQGGESDRYSVSAMIETHGGALTMRQQLFLIQKDMDLRENFTGFLEDPQLPFQSPHPERGDLVETHSSVTTFGARGFARATATALGQPQALEVGYFARGDHAVGTVQRIAADTNEPYRTDVSLDSLLGDIGLYADATLRINRYVSVRGGPRVDLFLFDVLDRCAVPDASSIPPGLWPDDGSCLAIDDAGAYRDPSQRTLGSAFAAMPRASLLVGPWQGFTASFSYGTGGRSADPESVADGDGPLFATVQSFQGGIAYAGRLGDAKTGEVKVDARSDFFDTYINEDTIFSETEGRTIPTKATSRTGWAGSVRVTGGFFDELASLTLTRAIYDDTRLPLPFTPTSVFRSHTMLFGRVGRVAGRDLTATAGGTVTYIGPRPLPYAQTSDPFVTVDVTGSLRWAVFELAIASTNVLDARYELGQYDYVSDWHTQTPADPSPERHFSAGAPRGVFVTLGVTLGDGR
jgi:iron complex outermembrane recepter protein